MQNKIFGILFLGFAVCALNNAYAEDGVLQQEITNDIVYDAELDDVSDDLIDSDIISATSVANYNVDGSVFQQITDLEQEKVLMELEKERAQLDLDLDRLAAEKIKLQMEMDTLSGRAEQEKQVLQNEKSRLEAEAAKIEQEKRALAASEANENAPVAKETQKPKAQEKKQPEDDISEMYKLINVIGAGNQLQATLSDLETGQTKRVVVGKEINGFTVVSISLEDGVVFSKDGEKQNLNISSR